MLKHNLEPHLDSFEAISTAASKEHSLEKAMSKMEEDWDAIVFNTTLYRDTGYSKPLHHGAVTMTCAYMLVCVQGCPY